MARRKKWFLSRLSRCLSRSEAREMFGDMGLNGDEAETVLKRFWDGFPIKSVGAVSEAGQKRALPVWDHWARRWCREHRACFDEAELKELGLDGGRD